VARKTRCAKCDDFGRVKSKYGLMPCLEPVHRDQKSLCPWDGPTAGEAVEERCQAEESARQPKRTRKK
jgi:hypothetical protein